MRGSDLDVADVKQNTSLCLQKVDCVEFLMENKKFKVQYLRLASLLIFSFYLVLYFSYISELVGGSVVVSLFFFSPLFVMFILLFLYFLMGKFQLKIEVFVDRILYPKFFFLEKCTFF